MKRKFVIIFPVLALLLAGLAFSAADKDDKIKEQHKHRIFLPGNRLHLGVVLQDLDDETRKTRKIESGVRIDRVVPDSPAAEAGVREGDILLRIDGQKMVEPSDVRRLLGKSDEARPLALELLRDGKIVNIVVTPEKRQFRGTLAGFGGSYIGVGLQELNEDLAAYFKVKANSGVLVTRVEKESPAQRAGVRSGDVITRLNGETVSDARQLRRTLQDVKEGEQVQFTVVRHGKEMTIAVTPEKRAFPHLENLPDAFPLEDMPEFRENMFQFRREMDRFQKEDLEELKEQLKKELKNELSKENIEKLRSEIQKEMNELRKELENLRQSD